MAFAMCCCCCCECRPNVVTSRLYWWWWHQNLVFSKEKKGETDRKVRLLCHRQLGGLEKCFSAVGERRWGRKGPGKNWWTLVSKCLYLLCMHRVRQIASRWHEKKKKEKKRKGSSDNRYKVFAMDREKETKLEPGTLWCAVCMYVLDSTGRERERGGILLHTTSLSTGELCQVRSASTAPHIVLRMPIVLALDSGEVR